MSDYQCQLVAIETMEATAGADCADPRLVFGRSVAFSKSNGQFCSTLKSGVPKGIYTIPYLLHAYNVTRSSFRRRMKAIKEGRTVKPDSAKHTHHRGTSVINNSAMSKERYSPRCFLYKKRYEGHEIRILVWHDKILEI